MVVNQDKNITEKTFKYMNIVCNLEIDNCRMYDRILR